MSCALGTGFQTFALPTYFAGARQAPLGGLGRLVHGSSLCAQAAALDSPPIARRAEWHCYAKQKGRPDRGGPSLVSDWRGQPWRVPVIAIEPNAPALIVPVSASPSIVASHSSVIGIGTFMFMVQLSLLPSTLPFSTSSAPINRKSTRLNSSH